mgnify:CR=1 FL=1
MKIWSLLALIGLTGNGFSIMYDYIIHTHRERERYNYNRFSILSLSLSHHRTNKQIQRIHPFFKHSHKVPLFALQTSFLLGYYYSLQNSHHDPTAYIQRERESKVKFCSLVLVLKY